MSQIMEASTSLPAEPFQEDHDPFSHSEFDFVVNNPTTPNLKLPQTDYSGSCWSTPSPTPQQTFAAPVYSTAHTLIGAPNLNNPQTVKPPTENSATAQHITTPIQTGLPYFNLTSTQSHRNTTLIPQSVIATSLTTHTCCTNSYTHPLSNPLLASSLTSFPSAPSLTTTDNQPPTPRTPVHQQLTFPSNTSHFTTLPYHSHEDIRGLHPFSPSVPITNNETRDTNNPQTYPHAVFLIPTSTQLYMPETPYQFQIAVLDYTRNQFQARFTMVNNPYGFRFKNNFDVMNLLFNFNKPKKLDISNVTNKIIASTKSSLLKTPTKII